MILGILQTDLLSTMTIIIIISILGLVIFILIVSLFVDSYYKLKSKVDRVDKKLEEVKNQFEIEKRLSLMEAKLSKK